MTPVNGDTASTIAIATVVTVVVNVVSRVFTGGYKSGAVTQRLTSIEGALVSVQLELKQMTKILVDLADIRGEIRGLGSRTERNEEDIRDLRRGRGFIQEEIKGEWPRT